MTFQSFRSKMLSNPLFFRLQEEDLRVPPLPQAQQQPGRTYLVDHHPQLFEPPANYATMPRQPPGLTSTFSHSNTLGGRGGNNVPRINAAPHQFEEEERRRQAYIQSLGTGKLPKLITPSFLSRITFYNSIIFLFMLLTISDLTQNCIRSEAGLVWL